VVVVQRSHRWEVTTVEHTLYSVFTLALLLNLISIRRGRHVCWCWDPSQSEGLAVPRLVCAPVLVYELFENHRNRTSNEPAA
jgi:hypothetical protein